MSEYTEVEQPFLSQLKSLGWQIIQHQEGIPQDPSVSLRSDFREIILKDVFKTSVKSINRTDDKQEWLTDKQLNDLYDDLLNKNFKNLLEANKDFFKILQENERADVNELTGEEYPVVKLIDFDNWENNSFIAINQFRVDTPGCAKGCIIPDIVLFVNGLPLVVVECKTMNNYTTEPMEEGIRQLLRYSNRRAETENVKEKEGEEKLFWFNQFMISTWGDEARVGTITSLYEHFLEWKDIYPPKYKEFEAPLGTKRSQETIIQGMLPPETLLDIIRHFAVYLEGKIKVVCRYQQYRAVKKTIERLKSGKSPWERSGVVWHTQGSGKSLTMVFLIRKIRTEKELQDYKILMINDRTDLEEQLGDTAVMTDEPIDKVENIGELEEKLGSDSSNLVMAMIHKFQEKTERENKKANELLRKLTNFSKADLLPEKTKRDAINTSEKILILIDEAHRTQKGDMSRNMFNWLPSSTKIAFTGTPLITKQHGEFKTHNTFGGYIDTYKLQDAVNDGATVRIVYEGKTSNVEIDDKNVFDTKFIDLFRDRTEKEIALIKKKYGNCKDIFEAEDRIKDIADDLVKHYIDNILPNGFKAQVVANSKLAAVRYQTAIEKALKTRIELEKNKENPNEELIEKIEFLKTAVVISSDGTNEKPEITRARKKAIEDQAVDYFKKNFNYDEPKTGFAFLIVCDMLLTGFDAPVEQIMYIDKKMKEHNLLQAIARVNRTRTGKNAGYIVDYIGIANNLHDALDIYNGEDDTIVDIFPPSIESELPVLRDRYQRLILFFEDKGIKEIKPYVEFRISNPAEQFNVLESCVELLEPEKLRAEFVVLFKKFAQSFDVVSHCPEAKDFDAPIKAFGHILNRVKHRYKDRTINIMGAGEKIRILINEHLKSLGIDGKIEPIELLSPDFEKELDKNKSTKSKASEMEHAIRKHCKVNFDEDPIFYKTLSEKLDEIIEKYKDDYEAQLSAFKKFKEEINEGRKSEEDPFFDMIVNKLGVIADDNISRLKELINKIIDKIIEKIKLKDFWNKPHEQEILKGEIDDLFLFSGIIDVVDLKEELTEDFIQLAKNRHQKLIEYSKNAKV